jgi:hypothetical protein
VKVIAMRPLDLPAGVSPEAAAVLMVGQEAAEHSLIVLITTDVPTPDARAIRPVDDHEPAPIEASTPEERGQSPLDLIRSLAGKCELEIDFTDAGIRTTEKLGAPRPRLFKDVGECLAVLKARVRIGNDLARQQAREEAEKAKGEIRPEDTGINWADRLRELLVHFDLKATPEGGGVRITGRPIDRVFPSERDAVEALTKRQF